jgi:hypothetical protein
LVGHKVTDDVKESRWVMSCFKGQAIYQHLYESSRYDKQGYLTLAWSSGLLRYRWEVYTRVIGGMETAHSRVGTLLQVPMVKSQGYVTSFQTSKWSGMSNKPTIF